MGPQYQPRIDDHNRQCHSRGYVPSSTQFHLFLWTRVHAYFVAARVVCKIPSHLNCTSMCGRMDAAESYCGGLYRRYAQDGSWWIGMPSWVEWRGYINKLCALLWAGERIMRSRQKRYSNPPLVCQVAIAIPSRRSGWVGMQYWVALREVSFRSTMWTVPDMSKRRHHNLEDLRGCHSLKMVIC